MTYYKVQEYKEINITHNGQTVTHVFVENELYLKRELEKLFIDVDKQLPDFIKPVEVPKGQTYWFFGARFELEKPDKDIKFSTYEEWAKNEE